MLMVLNFDKYLILFWYYLFHVLFLKIIYLFSFQIEYTRILFDGLQIEFNSINQLMVCTVNICDFFQLKMWQFFVTCVLLLNVVSCDPIVKITKGAIKGQILKSRDGRDYYSFTGIPFAKPPIGELRFKVYIFFETKCRYTT